MLRGVLLTLVAIPVGLTVIGWIWNRLEGPPTWTLPNDRHWQIAKEIMP